MTVLYNENLIEYPFSKIDILYLMKNTHFFMLFDRQMQTKDGKHLCPRQTFYGYLSYTVVDIILCTQRISSEGKNSY